MVPVEAMVTADEIQWAAPVETPRPALTDLLILDDAELVACGCDLQRQVQIWRDIALVALKRLGTTEAHLEAARRTIHAVRAVERRAVA
jgi:hypothetical protein